MVDLPKINTELTGSIDDLARAFAEASALRNAWIREQNAELERGGKEGGVKMAKGWRESFERELLGKPAPLASTEFEKSLHALFGKMGTSSGEKFFGEFEKVIGGSGVWGRFVGEFDRYAPNSKTFGETWLSSLKNVFDGDSWKLAMTESGKKLGVNFSGGWIKGIMSFFDNPVTIGTGIPIIGAIGSELLAMIGGLGTATVGLGGIAAGVIGQLQNPAIKAQAKLTGHDIMVALTDSSMSMSGPIDAALKRYDTYVTGATGKFAQAYAPLASTILPLESAFEKFTDRVMPGLIEGSKRAAPIVDAFAREIPEIGGAVSDFLEKITASQAGNREGLIFLIDTIDAIIRGLGDLIEQGSHAFAGLVRVAKPFADVMDDTYGAVDRLIGKIPLLGGPFSFLGGQIHSNRQELDKLHDSSNGFSGLAYKVASSVDSVTHAIQKQSTALQDNKDRWDAWFGLSMTVEQAELTAKTGMMDLTDAIEKNGKTFDVNTRAGADNYNMLLTQIGNLKAVYDAEIAAGTSIPQATKEFQDQYDQLIKNAAQDGLQADQIARINAEFGQLLNALNSLDGKVVHYSVYGSGAPIDPGTFWQGVEKGGYLPEAHAATGLVVGPRRPGTMVMMGEPGTRGEVAIPQAGISRQRAAALGSLAMAPYGLQVGAGGGGGVVYLSVSIPVMLDGRQVAEASYEDFVEYGQERKNRRGSTGF